MLYKYIVNKNNTLLKKAEEEKQKGFSGDYYMNQIRDTSIFEQFDFLNVNTQNGNADDWGESDPMIDFGVEEILDMPTVSEVQMNPIKVTDSFLDDEFADLF